MPYRPLKNLEEGWLSQLREREQELQRLTQQSSTKDREIQNLEEQLKQNSRPEFVEVYCPGCMQYHPRKGEPPIPFRPGIYELCKTRMSVPFNPQTLDTVFSTNLDHYVFIIDPDYKMRMEPSNLKYRKVTRTLNRFTSKFP